MQDRTAPVFVVATANNIEGLPPELLRKGRFDELFFIDLPAFEERKEIFKIHLKLTKRNLIKFDLDKLSENAKGFSGSEIEECIKSALYDSFCDNQRELTTEDVICQIKQTIPLVKTMPEQIQQIRTWGDTRARNASSQSSDSRDLQANLGMGLGKRKLREN